MMGQGAMTGFGSGGNMAPMGAMGGGFGADGARNGRKRGMEREQFPKKKFRYEIRDAESEIMRSIFVGNLNPVSEKEDIEEYFAKFGDIVTVDMKKQPNSNRNRGFAFVVFSKSEAVDKVMAARPHRLGGTNIDCKRKTPKSEGYGMEERVKKIWIGKPDPEFKIVSYGLNEATTDEVLENFFNKFGKVVHIHQFIWKDTNKKRGYGYITFDDEDTVDKVVLLGIHNVEGVQLQCKKALSKEFQESEERKRMAMQQNSSVNMMGSMGMGNTGFGMNTNMFNGSGAMGGNMGAGMGTGMGGNMGGGMGAGMGGNMGNMGVGMGGNMGVGMGGNMGNGMGNNMGVGMGGNMGGPGGNMNGMMNSMQGMINTMQGQGGSYGGMGNNMQSMMNQMDTMKNNGNSGNMKEMIGNMNSMMGTLAKEKVKIKAKGEKKDDDTQEKMMGMMSNMMAMMNNMASMIQTTKEPPPPQPSSGYGVNQGTSQPPPTPGFDASNYGYGYANYQAGK